MTRPFPLAVFLTLLLLASHAQSGDWPQFRYDVGRTAASPDDLPANLQLLWTRTHPAPRPAFPHELRLAYDASYEPVVLGRTMFVPSMVTDSVTALDTETGDQRWRFYAEGPVRFAPVAWQDKVYFVSDDGYLYCLNADDGSLRWKFRGLPEGQTDRKVLGHGRLISLWPARGGPVLADGVVYFAAGLWPTEGTFVHAVDAETGKAVWSNTKVNHIPKSNWDHGVGHYSGLTPQGYLAIVGNQLVVPCGTQLPAFLDLKTGELKPYTMGWGGRNGLPKGCWFVAGIGKYLSHGGDLFDITRPSDERFPDKKPNQNDYKRLLYPGGYTRLDVERSNQRELDFFRQPVMTPEVLYESESSIVARDLTNVSIRKITPEDLPEYRKEDPYPDTVGGDIRQIWELPSELHLHMKAGNRLYAGGTGIVQAIDISQEEPTVAWEAEIDGTPNRMLAADDKLFVVTEEGTIAAFGSPKSGQPTHHELSRAPLPATDEWTERAAAIIKATGVGDGYALVLGLDSGRLTEELIRQTKMHVIAVDDDPATITALRRRLDAMGLYGTRASVLQGDPSAYPLPPFMASLVVTETPEDLRHEDGRTLVEAVFYTLRPYGGVACAWGALAERGAIERIVRDGDFPTATVREVDGLVLLARSGALPGAADWSHTEANAACTGASEDTFIHAPMSVLWFDAAQRWHKFPGQVQVRVARGRIVLFEEGVLRATDVYTGRMLWEVEVPFGAKPLADPEAREAVRYARHRQWGPPASIPATSELVVVDDAIYVSAGTDCLVFDPANGQRVGHIQLPEGLDRRWSNLRVDQRYLIGTSGPNVVCMDRHNGKLLWRAETSRAALHIAVGAGKVFCAELADARRGEDERRDGSIFALSIDTGERLWQRQGGARLRYSPMKNVVVTAHGFYRADDGQPLNPDAKPPQTGFIVKGKGLPERGLPGYLAGDRLLAGDEQTLFVYEVLSGKRLGDPLQWARRGCTGTRASVHLLTTRFRGNSAWIDLENREITPLLGVRPGCSVNNNLYPANGVLNIPNLTAGCTCNYAPVSVACIPAEVIAR